MTINTGLHKNKLILILKDISSDTTLAPLLGFKGGTAAMLFYDLPRFSVDLDFDLLDADKGDYVFEKVKKILESHGTLKKADKKRYTFFFLLSYDGKIDGGYNIKVEINKRNFGATYELMHYMGIPIAVMSKKDMAAHKMLAMYERIGIANRDIYDVWFFLKNSWPINKKNIEERRKVSYKEFLKMCIEVLEKFDDRQILSGLGELLSTKQKAWVKTSLKNDTIFLLRLALSNEQ